MFIQKLKIILNSNIFFIIILSLTIISSFYKLNNKNSIYNFPTSVSGVVNDVGKDYFILKNKEGFKVYTKKIPDIGSKVKVEGIFKLFNKNSNFNLFNYKNYCLSNNIHYYVYPSNITLISKGNIFYKIKSKALNKVLNNKYLNAFIMGDTSLIEDNIMDSYRNNGISHLFSVSGLHVGILSSIILFILNKINKNKVKNFILVALFLIFYMFLVNFSKSIVRSGIFFILLNINKLFKINISNIKIYILMSLIILIINPYNIYNTGFLFSYIITFYLIVFNNIINRCDNYFTKLFMTSLISFLCSIPILINTNFCINLLSPFYNLIFVPLITFIIFPLSIITFFVPQLSIMLDILMNYFEKLSLFCNNLSININLSHINIYIFLFYYALITYILYKISKRKYKSLLILILVIFLHMNKCSFNKYQYVTTLDVGQGDSTLLSLPKGKNNILIDTGGSYNYSIALNTLIPYLKSEGINKISYLILTHGDYDHMGEAINLVENFKVEKVIFNCGEFNKLEQDLIKVLDKKKIPYYSCIKELNIDDNKLYFLNNKDYGNENDNSSVIYTELSNHKFLFMGDAGVEVEEDLIKKYNLQDIDVLKVGHHGSNTSSSIEFIDEINPKYSIISVGKNNKYDHPNNNVLDNLEDSKIYRTDQDGSIMFKIKNNKLEIETCAP